MVKDTRSINCLESQVLIVEMSDEQALSGESIWLDIDISSGNALQETRLSDIRITADQERAGVWVDRWKTAQMLSNLVKIQKGILESSTDCGHATKRSTLKLLTLEQRLSIFEKAHIITRDNLNEMFGSRQLS